MASLIRLKQIESGSELQTSAEVGANFSSSVFEIIDGAGLFSSSVQVDLVEASNYDGFVVQLDLTMSSDLETRVISSSISQSLNILSQTYATTSSINLLSSSLDGRLDTLETFSSSLTDIFATDAEVYTTASTIIDQGEF